MISSRHERRQAVLMLLLANLFWGLSFPIIKSITLFHARVMPEAGTWFSTIYTVAPRFLLAVVVMLIWYRQRLRGTTRLELQQGVCIAMFTIGGMLLQNDGLQFTAASTSAFLTQLYAVLIPIALAFRRWKNPGTTVWFSCALVLVGVGILGHFDVRRMQFGRGEWETLLSSLFFMGQILWLGRSKYVGNRPLQVTFVMLCTEAVAFAALALFSAPSARALTLPWQSPAWLGLTLLLTLFCTVGAFSLMNKWQPKITTTEAGLIYCVEPIFGSALALFLPAWFSRWAEIDYPNERVTWTLLVGGGLITLANLVIQLRPPVSTKTK